MSSIDPSAVVRWLLVLLPPIGKALESFVAALREERQRRTQCPKTQEPFPCPKAADLDEGEVFTCPDSERSKPK